MTLAFIRIFFVLLITFVGFYLGTLAYIPGTGAAIGFVGALGLILIEINMRRVSVRGLSSMVFGLLLGIVMAKMIADILSLLPLGEYVQSVARVIMTLIFSYLGAVMALRGKDEFHVVIPYVRFKRRDVDERMILLDTSAVIDGRILALGRTHFFSGNFLIPRFVIQELQRLADSADDVKRQRGRRGLDVVQEIQKDPGTRAMIHEDDDSEAMDVDAHLIRLSKMMDAQLCTTDHNLSRAAAIQGVQVLNIQELVAALSPSIAPGELMDVRLVKEGKEANQAVAYTADGTMIVVGDARPLIGQSVTVSVVSILPTPAGRIIFANVARRPATDGRDTP